MTAFEKYDDGLVSERLTEGSSGKPLRICLLGYRSHPYCGGQGVYIHYLSKALVAAGHKVDVISGEPYPVLDDRVRLIKMPGLNLFEAESHIRALRWRHLRSWADFSEWWQMATGGFGEPYSFGRRVVHYLRKHRDEYDIVHDNQSLCFGLLELQRMGVPVLATIHHPITRDRRIALEAAPTWGYRLLVRRWHSFLKMQKRVARRLHHITTVSRCSFEDIRRDFSVEPEQLRLIYNGIDTDVFRPLESVAKVPGRIITTASADQPLKGLRYLLEAVAALRAAYPHVSLRVIGKLNPDGPTQKLLDELQLGDCTSFVSGISTEQLVEEYNTAEVAVAPSLYEGFGLPAGEAMACGIPIVSSDGGALPEVVGDAGMVVPAGKSEALCDALKQLFGDPATRERLAAAGRERIDSSFCWRLAAQQVVGYYREIIAVTQSGGAHAANEPIAGGAQ